MEEREVSVPAISCGHGTATIERELSGMEGVESVKADPETKKVRIAFGPPATWEAVTALLAEIGFPAEP